MAVTSVTRIEVTRDKFSRATECKASDFPRADKGNGRAMDIDDVAKPAEEPEGLSNAEIADRLASLAQLLSTQKENPYKVKVYRRAAARIPTFAESLDEMAREATDITRFAGIGEGIAAAIR